MSSTRTGSIENRPGDCITTFPSQLGWMAIVANAHKLKYLTFGHGSPQTALGAIDVELTETARIGAGDSQLVKRVQAFAAGGRDDFADVEVDCYPATQFATRVIRQCRAIPYGQTCSYGELAALAGSPRAARAVGNVMRVNHTPLVVPCHRVLPAGGGIGGYSAGEGVRAKLRLLEQECASIAKPKRRRKRGDSAVRR